MELVNVVMVTNSFLYINFILAKCRNSFIGIDKLYVKIDTIFFMSFIMSLYMIKFVSVKNECLINKYRYNGF